MTEQERLMQWMQEKGFDTETLAIATGDSYSSIYMMTKGGRSLNDAFKWRFALAFGFDEAREVFGISIMPTFVAESATQPEAVLEAV